MTKAKKLRVMVLYGGRSGEHEISLRSAASVIQYLDPQRFEVIPVAVDKEGRWLLNDLSLIEKAKETLPIFKNAPAVLLPPHPGGSAEGLIQISSSPSTGGNGLIKTAIDVVFPVMHGTLCEDGTIQGLFELADIPYVGSGVLASAVGMDKDIAKRLMRDAGIPIVPYLTVKADKWRNQFHQITQRASELGYPVFVKPANLGSSVGVHKVKEPGQLEAALEDAFLYDSKVLIERGIDAREIELAVLEELNPSLPPWVSTPGEVASTHEFYSYEAKYLDENGALLHIPAKLDEKQKATAQAMAREAFLLLEAEGMARVDLFLDKKSGNFYFNELNTIPGFTSISMYPKMCEYSGISYSELLSRLVDLAVARHQRRKKLVRDFHAKG